MDSSPQSSSDGSPSARLVRSVSRRVSERLVKSKRDTQVFMRKPRNLVAIGLFGLMVSRMAYNHLNEMRLTGELLSTFDLGHDKLLSTLELGRLLHEHGVDVSGEQVQKLFGKVDDEGNGFDFSELADIIRIVSVLPPASERLRQISGNRSVLMDGLIVLISGVGLTYLVLHSDAVEKKWAASSFHSAIQYRRMQARCSMLEQNLASLTTERATLEEEIRSLEEASPADDLTARNEQLRALNDRLEQVRQEQEEAKQQLEREVRKWQHEAEKNLREASMTSQKLDRMMTCMKGLGTCVKGLDAFNGIGTGEFNSLGAQKGFCSVQRNIGFHMDCITFGTLESDAQGHSHLRLYETSNSRKLGEGRDCAYRCTEMTSGVEYALKMYTINKKEQRIAIRHDLYAHLSQVGKHPRIVSYERVIESESTIFVLMELLRGKDLFDVVVERTLAEDVARPLFVELVEGLQHLHDTGVIHCDIKPENAMVVGNIDAGSAHVKLIDFGCSCFKSYQKDIEGCVVWDCYMPPEHAADQKLTPEVATDMWRLGCTLYVMLMRRPPFHNDAETRWGREAREHARFCRDPPWDSLSTEAKDLICSLIAGDPAKRLNTEQVLRHPWVAKSQGGN
uniref:Protein kinase domain-containing protein n=1 Tax=Alexandrium monilatum TaxID=311494 RepID=A0A7S4RB94_9DINO